MIKDIDNTLQPWELPEGWRWTQLGELVEHRTGDWGTDPGQGGAEVPVVRSTEMRGDFADLDAAEIRSLTPTKVSQLQLQDGDILVNKSSGSAHLVGQPCLVAGVADRKVVFTNFVLRLRPLSVPSAYLYAYLSSDPARQLMERMQNTTTGLRNLNLPRYLRLPVPLGEDATVKEAADAFAEMLALRYELKRKAAAVAEIEDAFKQEVFSGQLFD